MRYATLGSLILSMALLGACGTPSAFQEDRGYLTVEFTAIPHWPTPKQVQEGQVGPAWEVRVKTKDPGQPSIAKQAGSLFWWVPYALGILALAGLGVWYVRRR